MRIWSGSNREFNSAADVLFDRIFNNYISPSTYNKMTVKGYVFEETPFHGGAESMKKRVLYLLREYKHVTTGYMATGIKNYHTHYIIYRTA